MTPELGVILELVGTLDEYELERVQDAVHQRRMEITRSIVLERRPYRDGSLRLETRPYPARGKHYGPYWYFRWRESGRQRALYVGRTDDPESAVAAKLEGREKV